MRSESKKMSAFVSESRKIRKPLMEKKRRARINDSLETLKQILLESKATLKESSAQKNGQRTAKLEKADILEMTVRYLQHLRNKINHQNAPHEPKGVKEEVRVRAADSSCDGLKITHVTLVPTKLESGEIAFVVPSSTLKAKKNTLQKEIDAGQNVWRPW